MAKASFTTLKTELDDASTFLRSFTLGKPGITQRDGVTAIDRVSDLCDRLQVSASATERKEAAMAVMVAQHSIVAANSRLKLLRDRGRRS